ncbi:fusarubin cluster-esterase [Fusarium agapanthi]|uniref:Fusarubin cluster-esterase n=1 Tax=Fusarium agapanthi TaxID=1803897 RepID=A0A9P5BFS9_9HYPO|nr:fusarubin cluster-esterase [Fusarium agapanthi]
MKPVFAPALLFLSLSSAQYGGQIKVKDDGCPQFTAGEKSQPLSWVKGNNICADHSDICLDGKCFMAFQALVTGTDSRTPAKMGACPTDDCSSDCQTWDVESQSNSISVDCAEFTGQHYFYLASVHITYNHCVVGFLQQTGGKLEWIKLADWGIRGNSHFLHAEKNNMQIADIVDTWIQEKSFNGTKSA